MTVTGFHHLKIDVADLDRSLRFYCGLLGFRPIVRYDRDDGVTIVQVGPKGRAPGLELWHEPPHRGFAADRLHFALTVNGLPHLAEALAAAGVQLDRGPFRMGHELIAFVRDPDGYLVELYEILTNA
jgi:lactoylglutathione lyase